MNGAFFGNFLGALIAALSSVSIIYPAKSPTPSPFYSASHKTAYPSRQISIEQARVSHHTSVRRDVERIAISIRTKRHCCVRRSQPRRSVCKKVGRYGNEPLDSLSPALVPSAHTARNMCCIACTANAKPKRNAAAE